LQPWDRFPGHKESRPQRPVRVWVPGCSTGEEAYSLAIALVEFLGKNATNIPIQIFATDILEGAIHKGRAGRYPQNIASNLSPERLERFFVRMDGGYQVSKSIREMCVFAKHDLTRDPPFSSLDLISCRNVLIYLGAESQRRAMAVFHYALKPAGFILLGKSEAMGRFPDLFASVDRTYKIYSRKQSSTRFDLDLAPANHGLNKIDISRDKDDAGFDVTKEADRIVLSKYAPAGVIINDRLEIIDFRGRTGLFLEHLPGDANLSLLKMAREGLQMALRMALQEAKKQGAPVRKEGLRVKLDGQLREVNLEAIPLKAPHPGEGCFLILFEDAAAGRSGKPESRALAPAGSKVMQRQTKKKRENAEIARLEQELEATRKHLQSIIEEHEAANEELRAANEEVLSGNEELQSINEELETAKEELQSTNEELTTLNDELQNRNLTLDQLNSDMINLFTSADLAVIMLGNDLCLRRFTPMAEKLLNLTATDIGRSILHLRLNVDIPELETLILEAINTGTVQEKEIQDREGRWYSLQIRPYRTVGEKIDGAVLTWVDIHALKRSLEKIQESRDYAEAIVETVREPLVVLDRNLNIKTANRSFYQTFQTLREETEDHLIYEVGDRQWDIPDLKKLLEDILPQNTSFQDFEIEHEFPAIGRKIMRLNARRIFQGDNGPQRILLAIEDITERKRTEEALADRTVQLERTNRKLAALNAELDEFTNVASHDLQEPLRTLIAFSELLRKDLGDSLPEQAAKDLAFITDAAKRMQTFIQGLLALSRTGRVAKKREKVSLGECAERALEALSSRMEETGAQVTRDKLPEVWGDSTLLTELYQNLIGNALKFSGEQRPIIWLTFEELGGKQIFGVRDNGIGIEPKYAQEIFKPFRRLHGRAEYEGSGIGLATCRRIVERHGGKIWVESEFGKGAHFRFTILHRRREG
jgi:two-component system CheB/CheR fusion protein